MSHTLRIAALAICLAGPAFAQGGNETPRPPNSDPSSRVDRLQGLPAPPPGNPGNATGNAVDRTANPPPSNARRAEPQRPPASGRPGASSPTN